jgi:hypothetical protein
MVSVFAGCETVDAPPRATARDSVGVIIMEHENLDGPAWTLDTEPLLSLGGAEEAGPELFFRVTAGTRLSDGRIVILNDGDKTVRMFDATGEHLVTVGRAGEGPGDFLRLLSVWNVDRGVAVWDPRMGRVTTFGDDGAVVHTTTVRGSSSPSLVSVRDNGTAVVRFDEYDFTRGNEVQPQYTYPYIADVDGSLVDTLPPLVHQLAGLRGRQAYNPTPASFAQMSGRGDVIWYGSTLEPELTRISPSGEVVRLIRWPRISRRPNEEDVRAHAAELADLTGGNAAVRTRIEESLLNSPIAEHFPSHGALRIDAQMAIWMEEYRIPGEEGPERWVVFDSLGYVVGRFVRPDSVRVLDSGAEWLLGVVTDSLDVETVHLFELRRAAG